MYVSFTTRHSARRNTGWWRELGSGLGHGHYGGPPYGRRCRFGEILAAAAAAADVTDVGLRVLLLGFCFYASNVATPIICSSASPSWRTFNLIQIFFQLCVPLLLKGGII